MEETNTSQTSDIKNLNKIDDAENIEPDEDMWRKRAREFARSVRDIAEIFTPEDFPNMENCLTKKETICIQNSCGLVHYQKVQERPLKILRYMAGKFFKNLPNNSTCSGGRKYNVPVPQQMLDRTARLKVQSIASIQANIVITTDSCCLLSIRKELRDCYPSSKVMHISVFLNETEKRIKHLN